MLVLAHLPERLAQEMDGAALPRAAEHLPDRLFQPRVRVGNDDLDAGEAALDQRAEEAAPERLRLALTDVEPDHLPVAGLVDGVGEHERLLHDPAAVPDLLDLRVQPQVGVAALQRPVPEGLHLLVEPRTDPRDLALRDPQAERLDHLVDFARRDAGDVRLLHDRHQRLLTPLTRLEKAREVAAAADLRDRQLDLARPRRPGTRPVAVAVCQPLRWGALAVAGADQLADLGLHQLLHHPSERLAQKIEALALEQVADNLLSRHLLISAIAVTPLVELHWREADDHERRGGRTTNRLRPTPSYTTLRDVTGLQSLARWP